MQKQLKINGVKVDLIETPQNDPKEMLFSSDLNIKLWTLRARGSKKGEKERERKKTMSIITILQMCIWSEIGETYSAQSAFRGQDIAQVHMVTGGTMYVYGAQSEINN